MNKIFFKLPYILGFIALLLLLPKLPGVAALLPLAACSTCLEATALVAMLGGGYFASLLMLFYLAPTFPSRPVALLGVVWALALGTALFILSPVFCIYCFLAHLCHIGMWLFFVFLPRKGGVFSIRKLLFALQIGVVAFLGYFLLNEGLLEFIEEEGEKAPPFQFETVDGRFFATSNLDHYQYVVLNFIRPECGYCQEQIVLLDALAKQYSEKKIRFFNLLKESDELGVSYVENLAPHIEIVVYPSRSLLEQFDVRTFPTLFILDKRGTIVKAIVGSSSTLESEIHETLK